MVLFRSQLIGMVLIFNRSSRNGLGLTLYYKNGPDLIISNLLPDLIAMVLILPYIIEIVLLKPSLLVDSNTFK